MTFSPLTDKVMRTKKHSSRSGQRVRRVVVHHWASTTMAGLNRLVHSSDQASANYLILDDGTLIGSVPEEYRAWTSGSAEVDRPSITVEIQNASGAPSWRVSDAAIRTLTRLIADVAKRYGWSHVGGSEVRGHREFAATACPGPYLFPRLDDIARDAEAIRSGRGDGGASRDDDRAPKPKKNTAVDGKLGSDSIEWLQRRLKQAGYYDGTIDGRIDHQNPRWRDDNPGLTTGWDWDANYRGHDGSLTMQALQLYLAGKGYYDGDIDGLIGPKTIAALQQFLKAEAKYTGKPDGEIWKPSTTVKALQKVLNSKRGFKR